MKFFQMRGLGAGSRSESPEFGSPFGSISRTLTSFFARGRCTTTLGTINSLPALTVRGSYLQYPFPSHPRGRGRNHRSCHAYGKGIRRYHTASARSLGGQYVGGMMFLVLPIRVKLLAHVVDWGIRGVPSPPGWHDFLRHCFFVALMYASCYILRRFGARS